MINLSDPLLWPKICDRKVIYHLTFYGPKKVRLANYPQDGSGRHFNDSHFFRKFANNGSVSLPLLMYSEPIDRLFCFCCLRFDQGSRTSSANDGFNGWARLCTALKSHESSSSPMIFYEGWVEAESILKSGNTIDKSEELLIQKESESCKNVRTRLMNIALCRSKNNMTFW
jgi:hypothetical protein